MNRSRTLLKCMFLVCGVMILCFTILDHIPMWPFRPVFFVRSINGMKQLMSMKSSFNANEADSLCTVLNSGNEIHFRVGNVIFVSGPLFFDDEMRWNLTSKSGITCPNEKYESTSNCGDEPVLWIEK